MDAKVFQVKHLTFRFATAPVVGNKYFFSPDKAINKALVRSLQIPAVGSEISSTFGWGAGATLTSLTDAQIKSTFVTLVGIDKGDEGQDIEIISNMPLYTLVKSFNSGQLPSLDQKIDISRSYLTFTSVTGITSTVFILFEFYLKPLQ